MSVSQLKKIDAAQPVHVVPERKNASKKKIYKSCARVGRFYPQVVHTSGKNAVANDNNVSETTIYSYVGNNPVNFIDPFGLDTQYYLSGGGTFGFVVLGAGIGASIGVNIPTNPANISGYQVLLSGQLNGMAGLGLYLGGGVSVGTSTSGGPLPIVSTDYGAYAEGDVGPVGVSAQAAWASSNNNQCTQGNPQGSGNLGNPGFSVGLPRTGTGLGVWAGGGLYGSGTAAIPVGQWYQNLFGSQ